MNRRNFAHAVCAFALLGLTPTSQAADEYPNRAITLLVPFAAGGAADLIGRLLAQKMSSSMKQPVIVNNAPGAGGSVGSAEVARAPADGYTILLGTSSTHAINPWVYKLPYSVEKDFAPITILGITEYALTVNPKANPKLISVDALLKDAKSRKVTYATMGSGTTSHLASALLSKVTSTEFVHVPYKNQPQAQTDLLAGHVDFMIDNISNVLPQVKAGNLRILATTGKARSPVTMDAPTLAEAGFGDYEVVGWFAMLAPAGTPEAIVARLNSETTKALNEPDVKERMLALDIHPRPMAPVVTAQYMAAQREDFRKMVEIAGAKVD